MWARCWKGQHSCSQVRQGGYPSAQCEGWSLRVRQPLGAMLGEKRREEQQTGFEGSFPSLQGHQ